ncbi:ubiquitin carboxyl-terminal hydrolase 19-like isoform X1 [Limulus polyphemus]|uniref:ubiquitinyl hydrolase 1 n=1 Tax=Limulus polyphemus TaxID=6850 RepID=A0ABM1B160_LIMPO|nr:ubiquitin carboxyl-terminal hydrolase 19-like isoform X1 [Limulus polyphemus]XP_022239502.1 ubiquitin carboxyl-terminal hydrolase 19-like isoform X1 [Limulus polyphemus]XP_022239503.1 ubiquitin carboxyl-terminal hydrolase 19-like isoform X1 [Limulus polyphemus]
MDNSSLAADGGTAKKRKDKHSNVRNKDSDKGDKVDKKRTIRHEWTQTDAKVVVTLHVGSYVDLNQLNLEPEENHCLLSFPDGRKWKCSLYQPVVADGTTVAQRGNKVFIQMVKKVPNKHWPQLEFQEGVPMDTQNTHKPIHEVQDVKLDWYEKGPDSMTLCLYIKNINKDSLEVCFEDTSFSVKFKTGDSKFLELHPGTSENTVFLWKINVKGAIKPFECRHRLTAMSLEINLKKECPGRWDCLESSNAVKRLSSDVPSNTWLLVNKQSTLPIAAVQASPSKASLQQSKLVKTQGQREGSRSPKSMSQRCVQSHGQGNLLSSNCCGQGDSKREMSEKADNLCVNQKPTCMVPPLNFAKQEQLAALGVTGLDNLGNTCFMNSVLQCLANTREFRDYFLDGLYQSEINMKNPLGMGGKLAATFAVLMKVLWSGTHRSFAPTKLKTLISLKATQFTGFAQHDAQEFMAFLLDGLHEDLNRVKNKPYTENVDSDGRPDEDIADEAWHLYKSRNDSIVVDLFQGQYKSKLVCPVCNKVSITFDPFLYLSVPLPKKLQTFTVIFFTKDPYCRPVQYTVTLNQNAAVEDLKEKVSKKFGVKANNLRVFEVYKRKIQKFFGKGSTLSGVTPNDQLFVFEVLDEILAGEPVLEFAVIQRIIIPRPMTRCSYCRRECPPGGARLKRCTKCYSASYCDQTCQKNHWNSHKNGCKLTPELVGCPFIVRIPVSQLTYPTLARILEAYSRYSVDVFQPPLQMTTGIKRSSSLSSSGTLNVSLSEQSTSQSFDSGISLSVLTTDSSLQTDSSSIQSDRADPTVCTDSTETNCPVDPSVSLQHQEEESKENETDTDGTFCNKDEMLTPLNVFRNKARMPTIKESVRSGREESAQTQDSNIVEELKHDDTSGEFVSIPPSSNKIPTPESSPSSKDHPLTRIVFGHSLEEGTDHLSSVFTIRPVNQYGQNIPGDILEDKGEELLDMSSMYFLGMDWQNYEKQKNYVLVESKDLDVEYYDDDRETLKKDSKDITLTQCLQLFTEPEVLSPQEAWYCPRCKEHREATKQLSLWRLPPVLIIQLKRFSFKNLIWRDKIDKMVEFPLRGLDLSPYFCGPISPPGVSPLYDLYAVINHHGGILGGHYTAFGRCVNLQNTRRSEIDWRLFDDSRVSFVPETSVVTRSAYMLFYRQRGMPFNFQKPAATCSVKSVSKEQKQRENLLDLEADLDTDTVPTISVSDSNVISSCDILPSSTDMETLD